MPIITMERIFHPVGQGAFFTERFFSPIQGGKLLFSVAYDCGTVSEKKLLENEIDKMYCLGDNKKQVIDWLFISHFDEDHINGVTYLLDNDYITKEKTKIFLPLHKYPALHLLLACDLDKIDGEDSVSALTILGRLQSEGFSFVFVSSSSTEVNVDDSRPPEPIIVDVDAEEGYRIQGEETTIGGINGTEIKSGTPLRLALRGGFVFWQYVPFNIYGNDEAAILAAFENEVKSAGLKIDCLDNGFTLFDEHNKKMKEADEAKKKKSEVKTDLKKLKKIYEKTGKKIGKKKATNQNVSSLILLSNYWQKDFYMICDVYRGSPQESYPWSRKMLFPASCIPGEKTSCLYTGDTDFSDKTYYDNLISRVLRSVMPKGGSQIALVQLPHHGTINNYNDKQKFTPQDNRICTWFVNFDTRHKIFSFRVFIDYYRNKKPLFLVTEDISTTMCLHYHFFEIYAHYHSRAWC